MKLFLSWTYLFHIYDSEIKLCFCTSRPQSISERNRKGFILSFYMRVVDMFHRSAAVLQFVAQCNGGFK